jgi:FkbM family methyltransferase
MFAAPPRGPSQRSILMARTSKTLAEWRTLAAKRLFAGGLLELISAAKWAVYPSLVRFTPWLAIAIHEPESSRAFWRAIEPGAIVIDGGANRGGFSILASRRAGSKGRVFAFEPEPRNFATLTRRMRPFPNVTPVQKAISGAPGEAVLQLDRFHAGHTLHRDIEAVGSVTVPVTSMDAFVREHSLPGLDVVKLDIEGAELEAIADGMREVLASPRRPVVICEIHPPITPEQIIAPLAAHGYLCTVLDAELTGQVHDVPVHVLATPPERTRNGQ